MLELLWPYRSFMNLHMIGSSKHSRSSCWNLVLRTQPSTVVTSDPLPPKPLSSSCWNLILPCPTVVNSNLQNICFSKPFCGSHKMVNHKKDFHRLSNAKNWFSDVGISGRVIFGSEVSRFSLSPRRYRGSWPSMHRGHLYENH